MFYVFAPLLWPPNKLPPVFAWVVWEALPKIPPVDAYAFCAVDPKVDIPNFVCELLAPPPNRPPKDAFA